MEEIIKNVCDGLINGNISYFKTFIKSCSKAVLIDVCLELESQGYDNLKNILIKIRGCSQ